VDADADAAVGGAPARSHLKAAIRRRSRSPRRRRDSLSHRGVRRLRMDRGIPPQSPRRLRGRRMSCRVGRRRRGGGILGVGGCICSGSCGNMGR
jgi:hypothetical protein